MRGAGVWDTIVSCVNSGCEPSLLLQLKQKEKYGYVQ